MKKNWVSFTMLLHHVIAFSDLSSFLLYFLSYFKNIFSLWYFFLPYF